MPGGRGKFRKVFLEDDFRPGVPGTAFFSISGNRLWRRFNLTGIKGLTLKMGQTFRKSIFFS
jgi:hypothetical protein